jgi:hypothetical protein
MTGLRRGSLLGVLFAILLGAIWITPAPACPFCSSQGLTLLGEVNQASMVLFGTIVSSKPDLSDTGNGGTSDLQIETILKNNEILGDRKLITLPRYIPIAEKNPKFVVFCDVFKGKIDPLRGIPVAADSDMVKYLRGALAVKDKPIGDRLRFYFEYLDNKDLEISADAYKEFANADYKDYREMAKDLPPDKIAAWLEDPNTPGFRYGLYASMLGHCGTEKHAELLHKMLEDPQKRAGSGVDGMLAGYAMLKPKEGMTYIGSLLKDSSKEFMLRYATLRAVRFFWDFRTDIADKKTLVASVSPLLDQSDICDLVIEDFRKWSCWDLADRILGLYGKKSHDVPIIRRAIIRYALSCPQSKAKEFIEQQRKADAETIKDAEELLKLETGKAS